MRYNKVYIESFSYALPEKVLTTEEIENKLKPLYERLKLPFGRLEQMSGIKERRYWSNGTMPSDASIMAAKNVLKKSPHISKNDIGCVLHTSVSRDFLEPATANVVHDSLGLSDDCTIYDISNACLGFMNGMITIADKIELGQIKAGLVLSGENGKPLLDTTIDKLLTDTSLSRRNIKEYIASLTIGSGAASALLVSESLTRNGHKLIGGMVQSATQHNELCRSAPDTGVKCGEEITMRTDSEAVLVNGCKLAKRTWKRFKEELGWDNDTADRIFCHQVGTSHKRMLFETLKLPVEKDFSTVEFLGNIGSASLPITVTMGEEKNLVKSGNNVALLGIGSGLNCIMLGVSW
jgi:3-oxoacyl-[acyl-carrier-protein] synthase-3